MSDPEAFSATAAIALIRIDELEPFVQTLANEIELRSIDVSQALRINENLHAAVFENHVFGSKLIDVFQLVSEPGTAALGCRQSRTCLGKCR